MTAEPLLLDVALCLYLLATVAALAAVALRTERTRQLLPRLLWGGLAAHLTAIAIRWSAAGPSAVTRFDAALSVLGALLVTVFLLVQRRWNLMALGAVVCPFAFGLTLTAVAMHQRAGPPLPPPLESIWLPIHVLLALLGDAVFAIAFSASLLYLLQERRLKERPARGLWRNLPSLETLDRLNYTCLVWGLVLLTAGIVTGIIWAHTAWGGFWSSDPKLVLTLVVWGIYAVLLQGRMTAGWQGRRAATLTIAGFAVLLLSLVGVNVFSLGNHGKAF